MRSLFDPSRLAFVHRGVGQPALVEYQKQAAAYAAAEKVYLPRRAKFDAQYPPCPDGVLPGHHWTAHDWLRRKHRLDEPRSVMDAADEAMRKVIAHILATGAQTPFGIGVKLCAMPKDSHPDGPRRGEGVSASGH